MLSMSIADDNDARVCCRTWVRILRAPWITVVVQPQSATRLRHVTSISKKVMSRVRTPRDCLRVSRTGAVDLPGWLASRTEDDYAWGRSTDGLDIRPGDSVSIWRTCASEPTKKGS